MSETKLSYGLKLRFHLLTKLAKACLVLPVSNAEPERVFSMLKKLIQTEFRSELANDTICALICAKQNSDVDCYNYTPDNSVLKKAKSATAEYNASKM